METYSYSITDFYVFFKRIFEFYFKKTKESRGIAQAFVRSLVILSERSDALFIVRCSACSENYSGSGCSENYSE